MLVFGGGGAGRRTSYFSRKTTYPSLTPSIYCSGVLRRTLYNPTKICVLHSTTAVVCICSECVSAVQSMCSQYSSMCSHYVFAVQYVFASQYIFALHNVCVRSTCSLMFGATSKWRSVSAWSCPFVLAPDLGLVSALTTMLPFFAVRLHRGSKLCISDGGSLWAGKIAVLLQFITVGKLPIVCGILRSWVAGRCSFPCPWVLQVNKNGCRMNKICQFMKSKHRAGYTGCIPEQNRVVRREHILGAVIGAVLRVRAPKKRFGVLRVH